MTNSKWYNYSKKTAYLILDFLIVSWIVVTITFLLMHSLPGRTGLTSGAGLTDDQIRQINTKYGLDKSMFEQYLKFLGGLFRGDFGVSFGVRPGLEINQFIWTKFGVSFEIGIFSLFLGLVIGVPVGIYVGTRPNGITDSISSILISIFLAMPGFVIALLLLLLGSSTGIPYLYDKYNGLTIILPAVALAIGSIATYVRFLRTEIDTQMNSQYAKFATVKGVKRKRFVWKHALRPALFPIATFFPFAVVGSFVGSMFVEPVFGVPGSGSLIIDGINSKDYNVVQFLVILFTMMTIVSFALRDLLYKLLDPRVRK